MDNKFTINNVEICVVGQYIPSEVEIENYISAASRLNEETLTGITISCGPEFVSCYFDYGEVRKFYRSRRLIRSN